MKLVGWSITEPGMYPIAACSLRLRPFFISDSPLTADIVGDHGRSHSWSLNDSASR